MSKKIIFSLLVLIIIIIGMVFLFTSGILTLDWSQLQNTIESESTIPENLDIDYKINSSCELAEFNMELGLRTNVDVKNHLKLDKRLFVKATVETWNVQYGELFGNLSESDLNPERVGETRYPDGTIPYVYGYSFQGTFGKKIQSVGYAFDNNKFFELVNYKYQFVFIDSFFEENSINPIMRDEINKIFYLYVPYLLEPHKYSEDLSCGKRYYEKYADETFTMLEKFNSIETANQINEEIKQILYG